MGKNFPFSRATLPLGKPSVSELQHFHWGRVSPWSCNTVSFHFFHFYHFTQFSLFSLLHSNPSFQTPNPFFLFEKTSGYNITFSLSHLFSLSILRQINIHLDATVFKGWSLGFINTVYSLSGGRKLACSLFKGSCVCSDLGAMVLW